MRRPSQSLPIRSRCVACARLALALVLTLGPAIATATDRYEGTAYASRSGKMLYRETHWRYLDQGRAARLVLYRCVDGAPFARKRVWGAALDSAPDFEFIDARDGYREGVRTAGGKREVYWQENAKSAPRRRTLASGADTVMDAGFDALVRARWETLAAGRSVAAKFLLPSRLDFVDVSIRKLATTAAADELRLRMKVDAWYGFAVPPVELAYRQSDRWLLRFQGTGTIRDGRGRHQDVRIEFPPQLRVASVNRSEVETALAVPLTGQCGG